MPFITTNDGVEINYEERGSGPALLLIHGWSSNGTFFRHNVEGLAKDFRVIVMDLRGHGQSDTPKSGYRIARMAKDVWDLIAALDLRDTAVLGWAMGASILWSYMELFGTERLAKAIFVNQSPRQYYTKEWKWGQVGCFDAESLAVLSTRLKYDPIGVARELLVEFVAERLPEEDEDELLNEILKCPSWVRAEMMTDHTNLDWRSFLPNIALPTMVVVGRRNQLFPWQGCAYVAEQIPKARLEIFEDSGHMPFFEEPERFNAVVRDFLSSG